MKKIKLHGRSGQGKYISVDDNDFDKLNLYRWYLLGKKPNEYACAEMYKISGKYIPQIKKRWTYRFMQRDNNGQFTGKYLLPRAKRVLMHRFIMNAKKDQMIDHINRNTLDNRKTNLRFCSSTENHANQTIRSDNKSGYKGVVWHKRIKKWQAGITLKRKRMHIGYFIEKLEAAKAYNNKATQLFGEFAKLNHV